MKKLIFKLVVFFFALIFSADITLRILDLNIIPPLIFQDDNSGLPKYLPNQSYFFTNGNLYIIGANGNTGQQKKACKDCPTLSVIGDSYIESLMNPNDCHQSVLLQNNFTSVNFTSSAMSGATFIQMLEMAKALEKQQPILHHLIYLHHGDFTESIDEIENNNQFRYSLTRKEIIKPVLNKKTILYKHYLAKYLAFPYYIYRKSLVKSGEAPINSRDVKNKIDFTRIDNLLSQLCEKYQFDKTTLILSPDTHVRLDSILKKYHIQFLRLKASNYKLWSHLNDPHWSCVGHKNAAKQVTKFIQKRFSLK